MPKTPVLMIAAALLTVSPAFAQNAATTYPARAIKIIVGFAAGGGTDIVARLVAQKMQENFGQSVFVENRPGGNSMLGPDIAARSAPDGYTLLFAATGQMAVSPAVYPKIPYQPLRDFVPVSMVSSYPLIMVVNGQHPATTMKDFIAWTKANPDKTNYASTSAAFTLTSELFKLRTGTPGQAIPFKSGNDSVMRIGPGGQKWSRLFAAISPVPGLPRGRGSKEQSTKARINEVLTSVCKVATLLTLACASGARSNARRLRDLQPPLLESMR